MEVSSVIGQDKNAWKGKISFVVNVAKNNLLAKHDKKVPAHGNLSMRDVEEELRKYVQGIQGVVFTSGEPTLQPDFPIACKKIKMKNYPIRMDTNGTNPQMLKQLINLKSINYVSLMLKAPLYKESYEKATGKDYFEKVRESVKTLIGSKINYDIRMILAPGTTEEDVLDLTRQLNGCKCFVLEGFVPGNCVDSSYDSFPETSREELLSIAKKIDSVEEVRIKTSRGEEKIA